MIIIIVQLLYYIYGTLTWGIFFLCLGIIYTSFLIAHRFPKLPIVTFLREIHQNNLEDIKEQELEEVK